MSTVSTVTCPRSAWNEGSRLTASNSYKTTLRADPAHSESNRSSPRRGAPVEMRMRVAYNYQVLDSHRSRIFFTIIHEIEGQAPAMADYIYKFATAVNKQFPFSFTLTKY